MLTRLLAPFVPFITEEVWATLGAPDAESVHLTTWPDADESLVDPALGRQMAQVRQLVELGRATRAEGAVKTRQPLARALVSAPDWDSMPDELRAQIAEELNVEMVGALADEGELVEHSAKANFRSLGRRFGATTPVVAAAVAAADAGELSAALREHGVVTLTVDGGPVELMAEDVVLSEVPRSGWAVSSDSGATVALDLSITPELRRAGLARDVIRAVQESRKASGLEITDRIELWWSAEGESADAVREHARHIGEEVLAVTLTEGAPTRELLPHTDADLGLTWWLRAAGA